MNLLLGAFLTLAPASARAGSYFQQASIPVAAGAVYALDRDALGNLYVLGLPAGSTHYRVSGYQTPEMTPLFSFETGVSSPVAFAVEDSGIIDVLDAPTAAVVLKRFQNTGAFLGQTTYPLGNAYETHALLGAAIDKANGLVYLGYNSWATFFCLACIGCPCPPPAWVGVVEQYDLSGTLLRFLNLPGKSSSAGSCYTPSLLSADPQGSLYVADNLCQHVLKYSMTGALVGDYPASGWSANNFTPRGMWTDAASRLYISQPVCGVSGCQPSIVKLDGAANLLATVTADSARGCAWDERVLYLSSAGQAPLRRFVENGVASVPGEIAPIGASVQHSSAAALEWQYSNDPDGDPVTYLVSLGTSPTQLAPLASTPLQRVETPPLSFETTYYWQVTAEDAHAGIPLQRQPAPVVSFRLSLSNSAPGAFSVLSGTGTAVTREASVLLAWSPSGDPDGDPVVYDVAWRAAGEAVSATFTTVTPSLTMSGLSFGMTYFWSVRARDVYGATTPASAPAEQTYLAVFKNSPPAAPAYLASPAEYWLHTASPAVTMGWAASQDPDGDGVTYRMDVTVGGGAWSVDLGTGTSLTLAAVFETTYSWRVVATDSYGAASTGAWRTFIVHLANQAPAPIVYSSPETLITRATSYALAWQDSGDPDGDAYSYSLAVSTAPGNLMAVQTGLRTSHPLAFQYGTTYYWQVTAVDSFGARTAAQVRTFLALFKNAPPGMPAILSGSGASFQHTLTPAATLSWSAVTDLDGDATAYRLWVGGSPQSLALVRDGPLTSYDLPSPQLGATYYWQVSAYDPYGGAATTPVQLLSIQLQNAAPTAPSVLTGAGLLSTRAASQTLSWSTATDPDGDPIVYELALSTDPASLPVVRTSTATSYLLSFQYGTTYYWQATARDGFGGVSATGVQSFLPEFRNSAPTAPANLSKAGTLLFHGWSPSQSFFWQDASDPDGDAFTYSVYWGTDSARLSVFNPAPLGLTMPNLAVNTAYYYRIVAADIHGAVSDSPLNWVYYQFSNAAPLAFDPIGPKGSVVARDANQTLSWTAAGDPDGDMVTYRVYVGTSANPLLPLAHTTQTSALWPGLAFGGTHYWRVEAYDAFGATTAASGGAQAFALTFRNSPPAAPGYSSTPSVRGFHTQSPALDLSWSPSSDPDGDAVSYRLDLGLSTGVWQSHELSAATSFPLTPSFETTYYWRVTAKDAYGGSTQGPWASALVRFINQPPTAPAPLTGTGTLATRETSQLLSWSAASDPEGDPVTYELALSTKTDLLGVVQASTATSYLLDFQYGTTYYWRVTARDAFGAAGASALQAFFPLFRNSPPTAPANLSKVGTILYHGWSPSQSLFWQDASDPDGDAFSYSVYWGIDSARPSLLPSAQLGHTVSGLAVNTAYYYRIVATDVHGAASPSPLNWVYYQFNNAAPLAFDTIGPKGSVVTRNADQTLSWTASSDPDGDLVTYRLSVGTSSGSLTTLADTTQTSAHWTGLPFGATYYWRVEAYDAFGATTASAGGTQAFALTFRNSPPAAPGYASTATLREFHTLSPTIDLSWSAAADLDGDAVSYRLDLGLSTAAAMSYDLDATTAFAFTPLFEATYYWRVTAADPYGGTKTGPWASILARFVNRAPFAPAPLTGTGPLATRSTSQLLSWSAAPDPDGDPVSYEFRFSTDPVSLTVVQASSATAYTLSFQFGTTYYWQAVARDGFGASSASAVQVFQPTFRNAPPTVPANLSQSRTLAFHGWSPALSVFWQDAADPDGDPFTYSIQFGTDNERLALVSPAALGHTFTGLAVDTAYYYRVLATDVFGAVSVSPFNWVYYDFYNNPPRPFAPIGPSGSVVTRDADQTLSWTATSDPDGDLVTYRVYTGTAPGSLAPSADTTQASAQWTGLAFGATHYWRVEAYDAFGTTTPASGGTQSFYLAFRNSPPAAPGYSAAASVQEFHTLFPSLDLAWSAPADPDGDGVSYRLDLGLSTASAQAHSLGASMSFNLRPLFETTYYWRVTASDPYGGSTTGPWASVLARFVNHVPVVPAVLGGTGVSRQHTLTPSATLSWSAASDPDGDPTAYRLALGSAPQSLSIVQDGPLTSYALPAPQLGATYYWQASAYDPYGGVTATPVQSLLFEVQNSPPAAPEPLTGTGPLSTRSTSQLLSWSATADPEGDPVTFEFALSTHPASLPVVQASTATSYTLSFQFGTTYYWRATARDNFGATSTTGLQVFQPAFRNSAPTVPANLSKSGTVAHHGWAPSLSVFWQDTTDADGDAFTYSIQFGTDSERLSAITPAALGHTFANLAVNTAYYYRVVATDVHGAASASPLNWVYYQFTNGAPQAFDPIGPSGAVVTRTASQNLSWTAAGDPDGDLVTYRVYAGTAPGALSTLTETTQTSALWPDLAFGGTYYWRVEAYDGFGATTAQSGSTQSFALAFKNAAPATPVYMSTASVLDFHTLSPELSLSWAAAADPDGDTVSYRLDLGRSTGSWQSFALPDAAPFAFAPRLGTTYYWRVTAADPYGGSTTAPWATVLARFVNRAPAIPAVLGGAGVSRQHTLTPTVAFSWSEAADPEGDSVVYRLRLGTSPAALAPVQEGTGTSYTLPAPLFGTTYYWQVSAIDHFGGASTTAVQSLALSLENSPPAVFAPLTGTGPRSTRETTQLLSWESSRDADGDPLLYGLFLSSGAGAPSLVQLSSATSFQLSFQYGTTYYWRLDAYDGFGGTTTVTGGAQAFYPTFLNDPPAALTLTSPFKASPVVSTMHNRVLLSWGMVTTPQGDPVTYTVYLGDSPDALRVLTRISQEQAPAGFTVSDVPSLARPQSQVELEGETLRLTLTGLDYYHPYYFRIEAANPYGATTQTLLQTFSLSASNGFPKAYNYPNPFSAARGGTRIVFNAPPSGYAKATVSIYSELQDLLFRREYANIPPGVSEVGFEGRDRYGRSLFNGSYICHVRFEGPDDKETFYLMVVR